jgi:hypothetical protein
VLTSCHVGSDLDISDEWNFRSVFRKYEELNSNFLTTSMLIFIQLPFTACNKNVRSRVSSGSIVSDYELDDLATGVRSPAGAEDFSSILCVQTGSGAHPASCTMVLSLGVKRSRGVMLTTHPPLVPRSWMSRSYTSSPLKRLHGM